LIFFPVDIPRGLNGKNLIAFFGPFMFAFILLLLPSVRDHIYSGWGSNAWGRSPHYILFTLVYCLGIPIAIAAFIGGIHSLIYMNRGGLFLICYAIIPLATILIISPFLNVHGYYLFFTMPAYLLLAAFCASGLMENATGRSKILATALFLVVLFSAFSQTYLYFTVENGGRPKWREAFQSIKRRVGADDIIVLTMPRIAEYYLQGENKGILNIKEDPMQLEDVVTRLSALNDLWRWKGQDVWFILDQRGLKVLDSDHKFREWIYANCRMIEEFPVHARVTDQTIKIWHLDYEKPEVENEFSESFTF